jgi:hypothetical protein
MIKKDKNRLYMSVVHRCTWVVHVPLGGIGGETLSSLVRSISLAEGIRTVQDPIQEERLCQE